MGLDMGARASFESNVDVLLKNPKATEAFIAKYLKEQGIEPNLETVLSFIVGFIQGVMEVHYLSEFNRSMNDDEQNNLSELLKRRSWELRQAFINARMEGL